MYVLSAMRLDQHQRLMRWLCARTVSLIDHGVYEERERERENLDVVALSHSLSSVDHPLILGGFAFEVCDCHFGNPLDFGDASISSSTSSPPPQTEVEFLRIFRQPAPSKCKSTASSSPPIRVHKAVTGSRMHPEDGLAETLVVIAGIKIPA
jgi:hypothetical protein